ncbi:MAG: hypothetical protein ABFS30_16665, partial [Pseudomonadota bacterium]
LPLALEALERLERGAARATARVVDERQEIRQRGRVPAQAEGGDGGVAQVVAQLVKDELGFKYHYAIADYLQRSARHIASATDVKQAYAVGRAAVEMALAGENAIMPSIVRKSDRPYRWTIGKAPLGRVANREKMMPRKFITRDGFGITAACRQYLQPLIRGEDYPPYRDGMPVYVELKNVPVTKKLKSKFMI